MIRSLLKFVSFIIIRMELYHRCFIFKAFDFGMPSFMLKMSLSEKEGVFQKYLDLKFSKPSLTIFLEPTKVEGKRKKKRKRKKKE